PFPWLLVDSLFYVRAANGFWRTLVNGDDSQVSGRHVLSLQLGRRKNQPAQTPAVHNGRSFLFGRNGPNESMQNGGGVGLRSGLRSFGLNLGGDSRENGSPATSTSPEAAWWTHSVWYRTSLFCGHPSYRAMVDQLISIPGFVESWINAALGGALPTP